MKTRRDFENIIEPQHKNLMIYLLYNKFNVW